MIPFVYLVIAICMVAIATWFGMTFVAIARFFFSLFSLVKHVRIHEPELWKSLGGPTTFFGPGATSHLISSPFARRNLFQWILSGGEGAELPETKAMAENSNRLLRLSVTRFGVTLLVFLLTFALVGLMIACGIGA